MHKRRIAVLRANGLGDFIFVLPALTALRASFPDAEIVLLGKALQRELLADRPSPVDRVVEVPPCAGVGEAEEHRNDPKQLEDFFARMRAEHFALAIQLHGGGRFSNPFLKRLGASRTLGLRSADAPALDINVPYLVYYSEILRYLEVVAQIGARPLNLVPRLASIAADREELARCLPELPPGPYAVLHAGATDLRRRWPAERFAAVARHLRRLGLQVVLNGSGAEEGAIAAGIAASLSAGTVLDASNRLSLRALAGLLAGARLMVSNDSGPLHLAQAFGVPEVGIYLACNIINALPMGLGRSRPLISWNTHCPLCGAGFDALKTSAAHCAHAACFCEDVDVQAALAAVDDLIEPARWGPERAEARA